MMSAKVHRHAQRLSKPLWQRAVYPDPMLQPQTILLLTVISYLSVLTAVRLLVGSGILRIILFMIATYIASTILWKYYWI